MTTHPTSLPPPALVLPDPSRSFWARIAHDIADAIGRGVYAPGERLPSETLGQLGLVRSTQGSGTYVEAFAVDLVLGKRTRHRQGLAQAGLKGGLQVLSSQVALADAGVAAALTLSVGDPVLHLRVLGDAGGQPLHVSDRYFPLPRFDGLDAHVQATGSITEAFARLGVVDYTRRTSRISARLPQPDVAERLCQPAARPTLQVSSVNVDAQGRPIEYAKTWFAGDRVTLTVDHDHAL